MDNCADRHPGIPCRSVNCHCHDDVGLERELAVLLNRHSQENASGTPDFILAEYLIATLRLYDETIRKRSEWRGDVDGPRKVDFLRHLEKSPTIEDQNDQEPLWEFFRDDPEMSSQALADLRKNTIHKHVVVQHNDGKEPWCPFCMLTQTFRVPEKQ
jgi:hypothetical protein